jgi:hypothetical protein
MHKRFVTAKPTPQRIETIKDPEGCDMPEKIDSLLFKEEGIEKGQVVGPLYVGLKGPGDRIMNYQNGMKGASGRFYAKWFTYSQAEKIAKKLKVKFEEC